MTVNNDILFFESCLVFIYLEHKVELNGIVLL